MTKSNRYATQGANIASGQIGDDVVRVATGSGVALSLPASGSVAKVAGGHKVTAPRNPADTRIAYNAIFAYQRTDPAVQIAFDGTAVPIHYLTANHFVRMTSATVNLTTAVWDYYAVPVDRYYAARYDGSGNALVPLVGNSYYLGHA